MSTKTAPTKTVSMPKLTDHVPYREVQQRADRLRAEFATATSERDQTAALLLSEFGERQAPSEADIEGMRLANADADPRAERYCTLASKYHDNAHRADALAKAVNLIAPQLVAARQDAQAAFAMQVFGEVWKPAVKSAGVKLLEATAALLALRKLNGRIADANLDVGPNSVQPLPLFATEGALLPQKLIDSLLHGEFISEPEAAEFRRQFGIA